MENILLPPEQATRLIHKNKELLNDIDNLIRQNQNLNDSFTLLRNMRLKIIVKLFSLVKQYRTGDE